MRSPQPVPVFNFYVALYEAPGSGVKAALKTTALAAGSALLFGFAEVSGLNVESELEEYREGGKNVAPYKFIKGGKYPTLSLKRGVSFSPELWDWHYDAHYGGTVPPRKNGIIVLADRGGLSPSQLQIPLPLFDRTPVAAWAFTNGLPEKVSGPSLNAKSGEMAMETLDIAHEGLLRMSSRQLPSARAAVNAVAERLGLR